MTAPIIVGAGPAGIRAAATLLAHGLRPLLIDEAPRTGGQIYRRPPPGFTRSAKELYGAEASHAKSLHATADRVCAQVDYRPESLIWNATSSEIDVLNVPAKVSRTIQWRQIILATGATDRILPVPGWTLPGVYSLGGAQVALKYQGCAIGSRVVFMGTGPLLYLVAHQYACAGATVVAVIDTARFADQCAALPRLLTQAGTFGKGLYYVAALKARGIPIFSGTRPLQVNGQERVDGVRFVYAGKEITLSCNAVGFGYALRSETQLADLIGCNFSFSELHRSALPDCDPFGRSSVKGVYLAGDGAGILGAKAAEAAGELAALSLLLDQGIGGKQQRIRQLQRSLQGALNFRRGLERAFPFPTDWAEHAPDELIVCRCENVSAGELRCVARDTHTHELNRLKALSRVGMGRCQGRMCGTAAAEILAHAAAIPIDRVGRLRGQMPIKPVPFDMTVSAP